MSLFVKDNKKTPVKVKTKEVVAKPVAMKDIYSEVKTDAKTTSSKEKGLAISQAYRVLLRPLVSEKASHQQTLANHYFFEVAKNANKIEVAKAVKAAYGIKPIKVNVIRVEGKTSRRGRTVGKRKDWKKAIVTLPKGKTIALYEGV
jgi:large subunit ribosomal protein L23